jgi:APA family basic amino acid/polyamine antiporter
MATESRVPADRSIWRRKPISADSDSGLERHLGLWQLTAIGIGAIIGAGIFTLAGTVANGTAGPGVTISFIIAGVASACAALSYAEFGGMIPQAGSAYTYGYAVLGEFAGWLIGWDLLLEYTAIVAVVAIGISGYFSFLLQSLGGSLPSWMLRERAATYAPSGKKRASSCASAARRIASHGTGESSAACQISMAAAAWWTSMPSPSRAVAP